VYDNIVTITSASVMLYSQNDKKLFLLIVLAQSGLDHVVSYYTDTRYRPLHGNCCVAHAAK